MPVNIHPLVKQLQYLLNAELTTSSWCFMPRMSLYNVSKYTEDLQLTNMISSLSPVTIIFKVRALACCFHLRPLKTFSCSSASS